MNWQFLARAEIVVKHTVLLCATWAVLQISTASGQVKKIEYQRDVQPILAEHCFHCHGQDDSARQSGLRLDVREGALQGGDSGEPSIVPGKSSTSELMKRILATDPDSVMPPSKERKPLSADQKELLRRWIEQGAEYTPHWAFVVPRTPPVASSDSVHPIDQLVRAKLQSLGMNSQPRADESTLCRRLYLDLIGLPPSPKEIDEFHQQGFIATVDKLLDSPRFGEKWARHWLDVARYSDTNGYEKDLRREQWVWRDWVIEALNRDLPYDQFLIEQMAGDLLPGATQAHMIATGFLRNSMLNEEGAIVPEQFRMVEMFDRMDCIGKAILGLTTQCAQCHSHKFDPLTQQEYYGMFAFLNDTYEALSRVYADEQQRTINDIRSQIGQLDDRVKRENVDWQTELAKWCQDLLARQAEWTPLVASELGSNSGLNHPVQLIDKSLLMLGHTSSDVFMVTEDPVGGATGLRLEALTHGDLPHRGPGRSTEGTWAITEIEMFAKKPGSEKWEKLKFSGATADFSQPDSQLSEGKKAIGPVSYLIDGKDETAWQADRGPGRRNQSSVAVLSFDKPIEVPAGTSIKIAMRMNNMLGCCRFSITRSPQPVASPVDHTAILALQKPAAQRSAADEAELFAAWRKSLIHVQAINDEINKHWHRFPDALTSVMHLSQRETAMQRTTFTLNRGEWDQPAKPVQPHTPAALHAWEPSQAPPRLAFARWLASKNSPLTARVAVNRMWQALFGEGLVATAEDFGTRAPIPEHQQVLDWLAVDFMNNRWSQKHLIRAIVSSETYQQSSKATADQFRLDPRNRWLARGPRFRAEAEVLRDVALSASGLIVHKLGGPPVIPPVPQNVLNYNYVVPNFWTPTTGSDRYRRTLYGFRKRSMPDPVISTLDGPNGDSACARRPRSNTPLAALVGLNEPVFVEAAQALALRVLAEGGVTDATRIQYAFRLCTSRIPSTDEQASLLKLLAGQRQRIADGWLNARELTTGDSSKLPTLPLGATPQDAAAWTIVARVLLNLDETITKG